MSGRIPIKFKLDAEGLSTDTFGWPQLREFVDVLTESIESMEGGPLVKDVLPIAVKSGSVELRTLVPPESRAALYRFRRGPTRSWLRRERTGVQPIYDYLGKRSATLAIGQRAVKPVVVPEPNKAAWEIVERGLLVGKVRLVGGEKPRVHIKPTGARSIKCEATQAVAGKLATCLYKTVELPVRRFIDVRTGAVFRCQILGEGRELPHRSIQEIQAELARLMEPVPDDFLEDDLMQERWG